MGIVTQFHSINFIACYALINQYHLPLLGSMTRKLAITERAGVSSLTLTVMIPPTESKNLGASCPSRTGIVILITLLLAESLMVT